MFEEACFLLHKKEDLESHEGKAIFALREYAGRQMLFFFLLSFLRASGLL